MANEHDTHTTGTQVPGAGHADVFPPFDTTHFPSQLLWLVITFGALYLLMSKIALPRVAGILENRQSKITSDLDSAAETEGKRKALDAELNAKIAAAETEIVSMKSRAMSNVDEIARDAASAIVQHLTGQTPDAGAIASAVAAAKS